MAVLEGKLVRNVAKLVTPPEHTPRTRDLEQGRGEAVPGQGSRDRLHAAWRLSLYGLRRGEVLGLRWSDIDLKAHTLTVNQARVLVEYRIRIEQPKSRNGKRTLPIDDALVAALTQLRKSRWRRARRRVRRTRPGSPYSTGTRAASTSLLTSPASRYTLSGTPTSSAACSDGRACAGSRCTTQGTRRLR